MSGTVLVVAASAQTDALLRSRAVATSAVNIDRADDAVDAIERVEGGEKPDVVVLDPGLEDPVRVAQRLHSLDRDGAVVVLSDAKSEDDLRRALEVAPFLNGDV